MTTPVASGRLFRKKPVVVEAERVDRDKLHRLSPEFLAAVCHETCGQGEFRYENGRAQPHVHTLEGVMHVSDGDWLVKGVQGEFYPVKPDIFAATYEAVTS
jgi:hypothetical protein